MSSDRVESVEKSIDEDASKVGVPLYSRFEFADLVVGEDADLGAIVAATRESLGPGYQVAASASSRTVRIWHEEDFRGRARLPADTTAAPQSEWRARVKLPGEEETPAEQCDLTAQEICERGGRVVVVIPVIRGGGA